ncbi:MAG: type II toxin-antitoxin system HicA family toxin [Phycicoccus sp.]
MRALERVGFVHASTRGSHAKRRHDDGRVVILPLHRKLRRGTLASILFQARLSGAECVELLPSRLRSSSGRPRMTVSGSW